MNDFMLNNSKRTNFQDCFVAFNIYLRRNQVFSGKMHALKGAYITYISLKVYTYIHKCENSLYCLEWIHAIYLMTMKLSGTIVHMCGRKFPFCITWFVLVFRLSFFVLFHF